MNADWRTPLIRTPDGIPAGWYVQIDPDGVPRVARSEVLASPDATDERGKPDDQNRSVGRPAQLRRDWVRAGWPLPPRPTNPKEDT